MNVRLEAEQELAMVDAVLSFFSTLLAVRTYLGKYRGRRGRRVVGFTTFCAISAYHY
jgi:hypothetical protein